MSGFKAELRKALIARRRALNAAQRNSATRSAIQHVKRLPQFKPAARVAIYQPFGSELDVKQLRFSAQRRGVRLYVPKITDLRRRRMLFVPLDSGTDRRDAVAARYLDLIVIPIVGIDDAGRRLGMGAGFFDRALAYRRLRRHWRGPLLVAIGFDFQRVPAIGADHWDARLDALATESRLELFSPR